MRGLLAIFNLSLESSTLPVKLDVNLFRISLDFVRGAGYNIGSWISIFRAGCKSLPVVKPTSRKVDLVRFQSRQYSLDERRSKEEISAFECSGMTMIVSEYFFISQIKSFLCNVLDSSIQGIIFLEVFRCEMKNGCSKPWTWLKKVGAGWIRIP